MNEITAIVLICGTAMWLVFLGLYFFFLHDGLGFLERRREHKLKQLALDNEWRMRLAKERSSRQEEGLWKTTIYRPVSQPTPTSDTQKLHTVEKETEKANNEQG